MFGSEIYTKWKKNCYCVSFLKICNGFSKRRVHLMEQSWGNSVQNHNGFQKIIKLWSHMVAYGPILSNLVPYGPVWSQTAKYSPVWSCGVPYGPLWSVWSRMFLFGPVWSSLVPLGLFGPIWFRMVYLIIMWASMR